MARQQLLFIGTLNRKVPYAPHANGEGLCVFAFDEDALRFRKLAAYPQVENPSFLSVTPDGRRIYANSEVAEWREGLVTAFAFDPDAARLDYLNTQPTLGNAAAHNVISADGRRLYVSNYGDGTGGPDRAFAVFDIRADGSLSPACGSAARLGSGPVGARQDRAHVHSVTEISPGLIVAADLGTDELACYRIGPDSTPQLLATTKTAPGAGPRHLALHPGSRLIFAINELDSSVTAYGFDPETGRLSLTDRCPTLPDGAEVENHPSELLISGDGHFLYAANRGHDSIAVIAVQSETGRLKLLGSVPCGGQVPRHLELSPSGRHLLVANQNSDRVAVLARDAESGALTDTGQALAIGTPMCLKFAGAL